MPAIAFENAAKSSRFAHVWQGAQISCACHAKPHLNLQKWFEHVVPLNILNWKCASHHNDIHFFDISTSKSGPELVCFAHFDLEMCFAPQQRALFRRLNFQKWSDVGVLCTF